VSERVRIVHVRDGSAAEERGLASLRERGAGAAWKAWRGPQPGALLLRFEGRGLPVDQVQRAARSGPVWAFAAPHTLADVMDLAFAGAERVIVQWGDMGRGELVEAAEEMEHGLMLWCDGAHEPVIFAAEHGIGLIVDGDAAAALAAIAEGETDVYARDGDVLRQLRSGESDVDE
jgi:hypothetical protein